jgi:hypothetical protein
MKAVSRFEADLLHLLHALLGRAPLGGALEIVLDASTPPGCLSRVAVELVQDALARGCVWRLARAGGWRRVRHLRGERIASGRLWERTRPEDLGLAFSGHALDFLVRLTAFRPGDRPPRPTPHDAELTIGDRLLHFFAYEALRTTPAAESLRKWPALAENGLLRLAFPDDFAERRVAGSPDLAPWTEGLGACVLEALQPLLAARWVAIERSKEQVTDPATMTELGRAQETVLDALFRALDGSGRRDLARFVLEAAAVLLRDAPTPRAWVGALDVKGLRMADRTRLYHAATIGLRSLERLQRWEREARTVGYFDEGYAAAQLGKTDWETYNGELLCERAGAVIRALDPLASR